MRPWGSPGSGLRLPGVGLTPTSSAPTPQVPAEAQLTAADTDQTGTIRVGQRIRVTLTTSGATGWSAPSAITGGPNDATAVVSPLRRDESSGYPADAVAVSSAIGVGTAQITSTSDAVCMHHRPAGLPATTAHVHSHRPGPADAAGGSAEPQPLLRPEWSNRPALCSRLAVPSQVVKLRARAPRSRTMRAACALSGVSRW